MTVTLTSSARTSTPPADATGAALRLPRTVAVDRLASVTSLAELVDRLGGIPLERIHLHPWPGTATEEDVVEWNERGVGPVCELVDGTLVEKAMAGMESGFETILLTELVLHDRKTKQLRAFTASMMNRMAGGNVRSPDVSVYTRTRLAEIYPGGKITREPKVWEVVPELVVEVLSGSNTAAEMDRKSSEYFEKGSREMWLLDPVARTLEVRKPGEEVLTLAVDQAVTTDLFPGFSISLTAWFEEAEDTTA